MITLWNNVQTGNKNTYADRREALIKDVAKRRKKLKLLAIEYKSGKCIICGYKKFAGALELHHIDPSNKSFGIGHKGYTRSWQEIKQEIDKCILLCANFHREVSGGIQQLPSENLVEKRGEFGELLRLAGQSRAKPVRILQSKRFRREGVETIP